MKALFIYNPHSSSERSIIARAEKEMTPYIEVKSIEDIEELKNCIRITPALIPITDDLQGENLLETIDSQLLATAMLYKRLEEEEQAIHKKETHRLDNMINNERNNTIDDYTMELIIEGVI